MMIKVAVVLCAIVATSLVCAEDIEEQDAVDSYDKLNKMLSEEAASHDDAEALRENWVRHAVRAVREGRKIAHRRDPLTRTSRKIHRKILTVQKLCRRAGYSPEEARAKILAAIPEMKEEDISEEDLRSICAGAQALFR